MEKRDIYKISTDIRTNDSKSELVKLKHNFNPVEVMDLQKSQFYVEGDIFQNTTNLYIKTTHKENKYQGVTRKRHFRLHKITKLKDNSDFLVNNKVKRLHPLESKNIVPFPDVSDEFSTSNSKYLSNLTELKSSKEYEKSDRIGKYSKLNEPRNSRNFVILRNRVIILSEDKDAKNVNSEIPLQSKEIDIALERANHLLKEQQHKTQNRKASQNIRLPLMTGFDTTKIEMITELPTTNNVNENSKPQKDRFTLTIIDIDENQAQFRSENLSNIQGSTLLDIDEPKDVSSMSKVFQKNETDSLKSTLKASLIAKQQLVELGTINTNEKKPYDLGIIVGSGQKVNVLGINSIAQTEDIPANKPNPNTIQSWSTVLSNKPDYKNNFNYNPSIVMETQSKILRNKFHAPLNMKDIRYKITMKKKKVDLSDDYSEAETTAADSNESDETLEGRFTKVSDQSDHEYSESIKYIQKDKSIGNVLRYSGTGIKCKKTLRKCQKACTEAYTNVCQRSKCSPKVERDLKYQCKKSCDITFGKRKYSSEK